MARLPRQQRRALGGRHRSPAISCASNSPLGATRPCEDTLEPRYSPLVPPDMQDDLLWKRRARSRRRSPLGSERHSRPAVGRAPVPQRQPGLLGSTSTGATRRPVSSRATAIRLPSTASSIEGKMAAISSAAGWPRPEASICSSRRATRATLVVDEGDYMITLFSTIQAPSSIAMKTAIRSALRMSSTA